MAKKFRAGLLFLVAAGVLICQNPPPAAQPKPPAPAAPVPAAPPPTTAAAAPAAHPAAPGSLNLQNASLIEVIDILARDLKINYILDPRVKGSVTINTYGEIRAVDLRPLLETILRINGAAMVQVGNLFRIVPLADVSHLPVSPQTGAAAELPDDERMILNMIFLKFATAGDLSKLLQPFLGESASMTVYDPANLLLIQDNSRNMKRTMELIALFDSDTLASQRVQLYETKHGRPTDLVKDLDGVFKAYGMSDKNSAVKFMPIDRINTIIAVAPNPGIFIEVEKWLKKLDVPVKLAAGAVENHVYRLRYANAQIVGAVVMQLYGGAGGYGGYGSYGGGYGGGAYGSGAMGGLGGLGGQAGAYGSQMGAGAFGGMSGNGMYGGGGQYPGAYGSAMGAAVTPFGNTQGLPTPSTVTPGVAPVPGAVGPAASDLTGMYLGAGYSGASPYLPRVIPNPFDNTVLVQSTPQQWEQISRLIEEIDIAPRQVLIEAKVYEVSLTGSWAAGVESQIHPKGPSSDRAWTGTAGAAGLVLSAGLLVGHARELLSALHADETTGRTKLISAPSIIATDSIAASINVGDEVPTVTAQAPSGVQAGGNTIFAQSISTRQTGVTLNILARVNSSGIVTMVINQEVSAPEPPPAGVNAPDSPSFSKRNVQTQVTVQDGDTISIGGIIQDSQTWSSGGIPLLHRIPYLGAAFGTKSYSRGRTELLVFLTPRVIYDTNQIMDATEQLKSSMKRLQKVMKE